MPEDAPVKTAIARLAPGDLETLLASWSEPRYRVDQILAWVYRERARSWDEMSNLPRALRAHLAQTLLLRETSLREKAESADGTVKLCVELADGELLEAAAIPSQKRLTACLSTQVGCAFGCAFCASGARGLARDLEAHEIIEELFHLRDAATAGPTHVVFMGIGEPLSNYENLSRAIAVINAPWAFNIARRRITVSTVGIPDAIARLARDHPQLNLAISLHAADDVLRSRLVPANRRWPLRAVLRAVRGHIELTHRQPTFEYVVLRGVNDSDRHALTLAALLRDMDCKVNLIPCHPGAGDFASTGTDVRAFKRRLDRLGVRSTARASRGLDIDAACGQLRLRLAEKPRAPAG
ncbi:MAG: 23S rRNA (adenine(2503)-C(2))-methyltransferase RlmN [Planctomycetota bacterium]